MCNLTFFTQSFRVAFEANFADTVGPVTADLALGIDATPMLGTGIFAPLIQAHFMQEAFFISGALRARSCKACTCTIICW